MTPPVLTPVAAGCPVEVFRWGGQPDHHQDETLHAHPFDEVLLINKGGGAHRIAGTMFPVSSASIHFLPAGTAHHLQRTAVCDGGTVIFLREHVLQEPYLPFKQMDFMQGPSPVLQLTTDEFSDIWLLYEHLLFESRKQQFFYQKPLILSWLNALFVKIAATFSLRHTDQSLVKPRHPAVTAFFETLEIHYRQQKTVAFYARKLCISPQYLHEVCIRDTGRGPQETIAYRVASEGLAQLSTGRMTVKQVAFELGFEDPAYFSRFLKKQTGRSPSEWAQGQ